MNISGIKQLRLFVILILFSLSCKKDFLDEKSSTSISQPTTIDDFQLMLENPVNFTTPAFGIISSDELTYRSYQTWQSTGTAIERNCYIWKKDLYEGQAGMGDWSSPYGSIFISNNVLIGLEKIEVTDLNRKKWNSIKGWALFVRANAYYDLVRNFSAAYDPSTAKTELGVPLRLNPSVGEILQRASVFEVYDRILMDLNEATSLLEPNLPITFRNRPSKIAVYALAARIYLSMRDYANAELNADNCLNLYDKLVDYNFLSLTDRNPFLSINDELIYYSKAVGYPTVLSVPANTKSLVSKELIDLYQPGDLRIAIFFEKQNDGLYVFKGRVPGLKRYEAFTGLATDEVYLIKAECAARRNDVNTSMDFLNRILIKCYAIGQFTKVTVDSGSDAVAKVLLERRKQLVYRGLRWDDLKRLNKEGANITLTRELNGETYTLEPNSPRYVFPIPEDEISLSRIQQNER